MKSFVHSRFGTCAIKHKILKKKLCKKPCARDSCQSCSIVFKSFVAKEPSMCKVSFYWDSIFRHMDSNTFFSASLYKSSLQINICRNRVHSNFGENFAILFSHEEGLQLI
jgi:hypothetical protein